MHYSSNKRNAIEEKLIKIIKKLEKEPDENEIFCLNLATSLQENSETLKRRSIQSCSYSKQCTTACMAHRPVNGGQIQPQPQQV